MSNIYKPRQFLKVRDKNDEEYKCHSYSVKHYVMEKVIEYWKTDTLFIRDPQHVQKSSVIWIKYPPHGCILRSIMQYIQAKYSTK